MNRVYRLLGHSKSYAAILHLIEGLEEAFKTEIDPNNQQDFPIESEKIIPIQLSNYHECFRSQKMQGFFRQLSDHPDLADHFCDLLFLKYLPQCKKLKTAG
jgi:hypothetical protein